MVARSFDGLHGDLLISVWIKVVLKEEMPILEEWAFRRYVRRVIIGAERAGLLTRYRCAGAALFPHFAFLKRAGVAARE